MPIVSEVRNNCLTDLGSTVTYAYRKAGQSDRDGIFKLYRLVMRDFISRIWGWNENWQENDFAMHFDPESITLVQQDSQLVGYCHTENRDDELYIRMIVVHPDHQGKGIGSKLLASVILAGKDTSTSIRLEVFKINHKAKTFYERHGFLVESETASSYVMSHA